jgi:hypothetical protein
MVAQLPAQGPIGAGIERNRHQSQIHFQERLNEMLKYYSAKEWDKLYDLLPIQNRLIETKQNYIKRK